MTPVFDSIVNTGVSNIFSMCMGDYGGILVLGDINPALHDGDIVYSPLTAENYYVVDMFDLKVDNKTVFTKNEPATNSDKAIIDSGTTLLLLSPKYFSVLQAFFMSNYASLPGVTGSQSIFNGACLVNPPSSAWPPIDIYLAGVMLSLPPELYFLSIPQGDGRTMYCFGIAEVYH